MPADGSGAIDCEELPTLLEQLGIWVTAKMVREIFPRIDLDRSGDIRQEELVTWLENVSAYRGVYFLEYVFKWRSLRSCHILPLLRSERLPFVRSVLHSAWAAYFVTYLCVWMPEGQMCANV